MRNLFLTIVVVSVTAVLFFSELSLIGTAQTSTPAVLTGQAMKITSPFTLAAVGDILEHEPTAQLAEPGFQNFIKLLRGADASLGNIEGPVANSANPMGRGMRGFALPKTIIPDLKSMGIRMMNHANNHTLSAGEAGMWSTIALLDAAGIVHAGSGKDLQEARASRFLSTPKGIVGLVGIFSIDINQVPAPSRYWAATYSIEGVPGAPGTNGLHLTTCYIVTADQLQALQKIRDSIYAKVDPPANEPTDRLELFGTCYKVGPEPGALSYTMNQEDLREILRSIRNGKEYADFMVATIHSHQSSSAFQKYTRDPRLSDAGWDNRVPDFLVDLAHQAIDNGADAFIGHGVHTLRGVEIYKGKPIFYGLSNFLFEEPQAPTVGMTEELIQVPPNGQPRRGWGMLGSGGDLPHNLECLLVTSRYERGRLVEVRLYPGDLGQDESRPVSRIGVPMTPSPEIAQRILEKLQTLSKPFGTTISIEGNVGVIWVPPEAQQGRK